MNVFQSTAQHLASPGVTFEGRRFSIEKPTDLVELDFFRRRLPEAPVQSEEFHWLTGDANKFEGRLQLLVVRRQRGVAGRDN